MLFHPEASLHGTVVIVGSGGIDPAPVTDQTGTSLGMDPVGRMTVLLPKTMVPFPQSVKMVWMFVLVPIVTVVMYGGRVAFGSKEKSAEVEYVYAAPGGA